MTLGVDPRSMLGIAFRKQSEIEPPSRAEFPCGPRTRRCARVFEGLCEVFFPSEGHDARVPLALRIRHGLQVVTRARKGVVEQWGVRGEKTRTAHAA